MPQINVASDINSNDFTGFPHVCARPFHVPPMAIFCILLPRVEATVAVVLQKLSDSTN